MSDTCLSTALAVALNNNLRNQPTLPLPLHFITASCFLKMIKKTIRAHGVTLFFNGLFSSFVHAESKFMPVKLSRDALPHVGREGDIVTEDAPCNLAKKRNNGFK